METANDKSINTAKKLLDQAANGLDISIAYNQLPDSEKMSIFKAMNAMQNGDIPGFPSSNLLIDGIDTDFDGKDDQLSSIVDVSNQKHLYYDRPASFYQVKEGDDLYKVAEKSLNSCGAEKPDPAKITKASSLIAYENLITASGKLQPGESLYLNGNLVAPGQNARELQPVEGAPLEILSAGASPNRIERIKEVLGSLPENITSFLRGSDINIIASHEFCDESPSLAMDTPRGYENGSTSTESPAQFDPKTQTVFVRQIYTNGESEEIASPDEYAHSILHEIGHALDYSLGDISHNEILTGAYMADVSNMTDEQKQYYSYYVSDLNDSSDFTGQEEAFAEVFSALYKDESLIRNPQDWAHQRDKEILEVFPTLAIYMRTEFSRLFPLPQPFSLDINLLSGSMQPGSPNE